MGYVPGTVAARRVSFVMPTYNRREVVLRTLSRVLDCGMRPGEFEVLVVDNASTDGTAAAIRDRFPGVVVLDQATNKGPCAKNEGLAIATGEFVVFLDDDSFPQRGSMPRMIAHFESDSMLGAAVFTITLPNGSQECSAYPDVCIGCGTGFRRDALVHVGGMPDDFFMAAEEYDLSLRLLDGGWRVRLFDDLHVTHAKSSMSRFPNRIARLDARNNMLLAMRYFPTAWRISYAREWLERYRLMAIANRRQTAFWAGALAGLGRGLAVEHRPIRAEAFEQFAKVEETYLRLSEAKRQLGLRRILFVDLGKNILAYRIAAERCQLEVVGIADARLGGRGLHYRSWPILTDMEACRMPFDAAIVSNLSPVHAALRREAWEQLQPRPTLDLFQSSSPTTVRSGTSISGRLAA
jgi:GT2 family glycosyltransferase